MTQSSEDDTNHKLLAILESIRSTLSIDAINDSQLIGQHGDEPGLMEEDAPRLNIPVLSNVIDLPASGTGIDLDDLDNLDLVAKPTPKPTITQETGNKDLGADLSSVNRAAGVDDLLHQLATADGVSVSNTDTDSSDDDYTIKELAELLYIEAEQIREEILAEFIPRMEQSFKTRLRDATSEILAELVERRMQARLKGYK